MPIGALTPDFPMQGRGDVVSCLLLEVPSISLSPESIRLILAGRLPSLHQFPSKSPLSSIQKHATSVRG